MEASLPTSQYNHRCSLHGMEAATRNHTDTETFLGHCCIEVMQMGLQRKDVAGALNPLACVPAFSPAYFSFLRRLGPRTRKSLRYVFFFFRERETRPAPGRFAIYFELFLYRYFNGCASLGARPAPCVYAAN